MNVYKFNILLHLLFKGALKVSLSLKKEDIKKYPDEKNYPVSKKTFDRYLKYLIEKGYIAEGIKEKRNIKKYYLTQEGLNFLKENMYIPEDFIENIYTKLQKKGSITDNENVLEFNIENKK